MRVCLIPLILLLSSCGYLEREREEAADVARTAMLAEHERVLSEAIGRADQLARRADRILGRLSPASAGQAQSLRVYRNAAHVTRARQLGVRVGTEQALDSLIATGHLVLLEDSTRHWIVRRGTDPTHVLPQLRALLGVVGERFQARLAELGLPAYRIEVTSGLRTTERQARLRRTNSNAAAFSSHEFGATVDVSYAAFAPPAEIPAEILAGVPPEFEPHVRRFANLTFESVSARKSRELGAILNQVLQEAQAEGLAMVIYELQQTIYHLTVASSDLGAEDVSIAPN